MKNNLIYALFDPRNDLPYYIGKSTVGKNRPITHLHYSHNESVRNWVKELINNNLSPIIEIIEENILLEDLSVREKYWISKFYEINSDLFNKQLIKNLDKIEFFKLDNNKILEIKNFIENISNFSKSIRYINNFTQEELSKELNINRTTLNLIEKRGITNTNLILRLINVFEKYDKLPKEKKIKSKIRLLKR